MDPNMTLRGFWDAIGEHDLEAAQDLRDALADWTWKGGFLPSGWSDRWALLDHLDGIINREAAIWL